MRDTLAYVKQQYGSMNEYMARIGFGPEKQQRLGEMLKREAWKEQSARQSFFSKQTTLSNVSQGELICAIFFKQHAFISTWKCFWDNLLYFYFF